MCELKGPYGATHAALLGGQLHTRILVVSGRTPETPGSSILEVMRRSFRRIGFLVGSYDLLKIQARVSVDAAGGVSTCCIAHLSANHTVPASASCVIRHSLPPGGTATC